MIILLVDVRDDQFGEGIRTELFKVLYDGNKNKNKKKSAVLVAVTHKVARCNELFSSYPY